MMNRHGWSRLQIRKPRSHEPQENAQNAERPTMLLPLLSLAHRMGAGGHATQARLSVYLVKGFTMDDERLKNPPGKGHKDYFDDIRVICDSFRRSHLNPSGLAGTEMFERLS
jgi:hypothetical protein